MARYLPTEMTCKSYITVSQFSSPTHINIGHVDSKCECVKIKRSTLFIMPGLSDKSPGYSIDHTLTFINIPNTEIESIWS